ncbi:hypothetical protein [Palaeococcus ferrophilus]|uniref:hypothetical protein n=1 Tax=Palaeococcus ferrophilus TaxID=83868 RepID=UPI00064F314B|nr:hypothetical protein [Palaeococcus ferrophilus]
MKGAIKRFKLARGDERVRYAWEVVREVSRHSLNEPFWKTLKDTFGVREGDVKEIMRFLEERNELQILRSSDGKRLYVSTLKKIRNAPKTLDEWLK